MWIRRLQLRAVGLPGLRGAVCGVWGGRGPVQLLRQLQQLPYEVRIIGSGI